MAAFLYPFTSLLGIDLKYRGGYSFASGESVSNSIERHQWLEFTCRPSMKTFTCDLWYDGMNDYSGDCITWPIEKVY